MAATGLTAAGAEERRRVESVLETLAAVHRHGETLGELTHDARNMVTALSLYCDLLEEPGVVSPSHLHYASELRLLAEASRRLVEKLSLLDKAEDTGIRQGTAGQGRLFSETPEHLSPAGMLEIEPLPAGLIEDLHDEVLSSRGLLAAIAGPSVRVAVLADGGARPVRMSGENLIRVLVNLVRNSADSIDGAGQIQLRLVERGHEEGRIGSLILTLEDTGCGIPDEHLDRIFDPGFTTRSGDRTHRGLGLSITRSIIESAGGRVHAENRSSGGARFVIELPVREA